MKMGILRQGSHVLAARLGRTSWPLAVCDQKAVRPELAFFSVGSN